MSALLNSEQKFPLRVVLPSGAFPGESGVLSMQVIAEIRRRHLVSKERISSIARDLKLSRPTVR
jgi:hypothetical protein